MRLVWNLLIRAVAVAVAAMVTPGVAVGGFVDAVLVAVVLGVLNMFVKPIVLVLTLPINVLTLGLFTLVVNTFIILMADQLVAGLVVGGFWSALIFGILLSLVNAFLNTLEK